MHNRQACKRHAKRGPPFPKRFEVCMSTELSPEFSSRLYTDQKHLACITMFMMNILIFTIAPYRFHIQMSLNFGRIWQGMPNDVSWLLNNLTSSEPQPSRSQPVSLSLRYYLLPPVFTCLGGLSWKYTIINGLGQQSHK